MSSSEELSDTSGEEYLLDNSECLDFEEIEMEERVNQELLSESSTADKGILCMLIPFSTFRELLHPKTTHFSTIFSVYN